VSQIFAAETADEAWSLAADAFKASDDVSIQPSRDGVTREILHASFVVRDPRQRWILSREPSLNPAFAIAEVVWILGGRNDSRFVNHWNSALPRFAGYGETYYGAYGYRLRCNFGFDQLNSAFKALSRNPSSRQVVLQIWDARLDLPNNGEPRAPDIPCNIASFLKVRDGRLEWAQILRSNDLVLGLPHNVVQFTFLQEVMAGWLEVELGQYFQFSDSLHVYERDWESIRRASRRILPISCDSLMLPKADADSAWTELERRMSLMAGDSELTLSKWRGIVNWTEAPEAFGNLLRIVAADDARRRGWSIDSAQIANECSNPILKSAWRLWLARCSEHKQGWGNKAGQAHA